MNKLRLTYSILGILFGIFMFVFGGYDDSPGAQLLGVIIAGAGVYGAIKSRTRTSV